MSCFINVVTLVKSTSCADILPSIMSLSLDIPRDDFSFLVGNSFKSPGYPEGFRPVSLLTDELLDVSLSFIPFSLILVFDFFSSRFVDCSIVLLFQWRYSMMK